MVFNDLEKFFKSFSSIDNTILKIENILITNISFFIICIKEKVTVISKIVFLSTE